MNYKTVDLCTSTGRLNRVNNIAALIRFGRTVLLVLLLVAIGATVLDGGEVVRQAGEMNTLLVVMAVLVAMSHVALAVLAFVILFQGRRSQAVRLG